MNFINNEMVSPDFTTSWFKFEFEKGDFSQAECEIFSYSLNV